jgi:hypothetical protein
MAVSNVRVVFFKGPGSWADTLIRWWTRSPYSHCELVFTNGDWFSSDTDGFQLTRFLDAEWTPARINPVAFLANYDTIRVPMTVEQEADLRTWCKSEAGCSYDWKGIVFSMVLNLGYHSASKWFCSEVCAAGLKREQVPLRFEPQRYSPGKLSNSLLSLYLMNQ